MKKGYFERSNFMRRMKSKKRLVSLFLALCMIVTSIYFVPKQTEASGTYWIKVNRKMNTVTVYQYTNGKYKAVKAMACSVGKNGATPKGNYNTQEKLRWHVLMGNVWGQYCTRIYKGYLFHSVWYYSKSKSAQSTKQYNKLGKAASHGCVRLTVADSKWIYDHCPVGTKVTIYDSSNPGPLGKPSTIKVSTSKKQGWDPTDPDPNNPYSKNKPTIKFASTKKSKVALYSDTYNAKSGVSATSSTGKNLTSKIKVSGSVNTKKPGTYTLTYTVKDSKGYTATATYKVTVTKPSKPIYTGINSSVTLKIGNGTVSKNMKSGVKAIDRDGSILTSKMKITCSDSSVTIASDGKATFTKPGTYKITYSVTGSSKNGAKTSTKTTTVKVVDNSTPSIKVSNASQSINLGSTYGDTEIRSGVSASTAKGTKLTSKVTYTITSDGKTVSKVDTSKAGEYTIKYAVTSSTGKTAYETRTVTVKDLSVVHIIGAQEELTIPASLSKEEKEQQILSGVSCRSEKGSDYTSSLTYEIYTADGQAKVEISQLTAGDYQVHYTGTNPNSGASVTETNTILHITDN
jgi:surface-anchored protein